MARLINLKSLLKTLKIKMEEKKEKVVLMKPGKNNKEDRINFIKFWANYIKTHNDEEWSEQQNIIVNSQIHWEE